MYIWNWNFIVIESQIKSNVSHLGHIPFDVANIFEPLFINSALILEEPEATERGDVAHTVK